MKKDTWIPWPGLTKPAFPATAHLRGLFAQSEESEEEVALLLQSTGAEIAALLSCFRLPFLHCRPCSAPLWGQIPLVFREPSFFA